MGDQRFFEGFPRIFLGFLKDFLRFLKGFIIFKGLYLGFLGVVFGNFLRFSKKNLRVLLVVFCLQGAFWDFS